jgi:hypothetical protein
MFAFRRSAAAGERLAFLRAACAVAEGAATAETARGGAAAAALADSQRRVCVMGGRRDMPRSAGSVYLGAIVRFLGGFRGVQSRVIDEAREAAFGMAVTRDGSTLLRTSGNCGASHGIVVVCIASGSRLGFVGSYGSEQLQFKGPRQLWISDDDHVFVAEFGNHRIQVLTPQFEFHSFVGVGSLDHPSGVCGNADIVAVSELHEHRVSVFHRVDGALLRRFGSFGSGDGQYIDPLSLCYMNGCGHLAVGDAGNDRISVVSTKGEFVRHLSAVGSPHNFKVVCSETGDELIVAGFYNFRIVLFSPSGEMQHVPLGAFRPLHVAIHGSTIYVRVPDACIVLT